MKHLTTLLTALLPLTALSEKRPDGVSRVGPSELRIDQEYIGEPELARPGSQFAGTGRSSRGQTNCLQSTVKYQYPQIIKWHGGAKGQYWKGRTLSPLNISSGMKAVCLRFMSGRSLEKTIKETPEVIAQIAQQTGLPTDWKQ